LTEARLLKGEIGVLAADMFLVLLIVGSSFFKNRPGVFKAAGQMPKKELLG
jgi:hypothetical protein